ncbi:MAG: type II toxin-antitoxin system PemK/MazF family toxin [Planctomycetaceae bacterium]
MALQQGSIVWVHLDDQAGRNQKCRPAVIVTPSHEIVPGQTIVAVAAVGTFSKPLPENHVPLPWQRGGHPVTGLYKECIAVCDWLVEIKPDAIVSIGGVCPPHVLRKILSKLPN